MGEIIKGYVFPHPPIIVPEIGMGSEEPASDTLNSVKRAADDIKHDKPTTIIVTTPHGPVFQDFIYISASPHLEGDFGQFGKSGLKLGFDNNVELADKIIQNARNMGILAGDIDNSIIKKYKLSKRLDHGVLVPLYFVEKVYNEFKLVHISVAGLPFEELYRFGTCIQSAVETTDERVVFIASGDLSHRLSKDAPYGYSKKGGEFDKLVISSLEKLDVERLLDIDEEFCESAGECGLRSFLMMFGAVDGYNLKSQVYSYEGPFGVGYSVARVDVGLKDSHRQVMKNAEDAKRRKIDETRQKEDPYVRLARESLEEYIRDEKVLSLPEGLPEEILSKRAGTFVSIKKGGQLRGCIGTIEPTRANIAEEIIHNAISSGTGDPRFEPVEEEELDKLVYSVDVLSEAEPIESTDELDVIKYGVIVRSGRRSGLLLPNLEGVDTPEEQVSIALQKAGISQNEKFTMERFEVVRHK